jgi:hypothetical protein
MIIVWCESYQVDKKKIITELIEIRSSSICMCVLYGWGEKEKGKKIGRCLFIEMIVKYFLSWK